MGRPVQGQQLTESQDINSTNRNTPQGAALTSSVGHRYTPTYLRNMIYCLDYDRAQRQGEGWIRRSIPSTVRGDYQEETGTNSDEIIDLNTDPSPPHQRPPRGDQMLQRNNSKVLTGIIDKSGVRDGSTDPSLPHPET